MPAYYWVQLYKEPLEHSIRSIVQKTCDSLIKSGCSYQFSYLTKIEEERLQISRDETAEIDINEAINYATQDLEVWSVTQKIGQRLPKIEMVFLFNFQFDKEVEKDLGIETAKEVKQVRLDFWIDEDKFYERRIVVNLTTWEEYVLMYGQTKTHEHNKREILKIVTCICNQITPYYGWLDGEFYGFDESYESIETDDWFISDEFVVVGPQLIHKLSNSPYAPANRIVCYTPNYDRRRDSRPL